MTQQYGLLNEAMHGVSSKRGGEDINRNKTTLSFWQESDESWKLKAPSIVGQEKFVEMAKVAAAKFEEGIRRNGLGWFEELEADSEKWQRFKKLSVLLQGVSPNEAFFGHTKWEAKRNPQERVDAIGAHASSKLNRTYTGRNFQRIKKNRLMLLCLRRTVKARRQRRRKQIMQTKTLAQAHKLQNMAKLRDKQMRTQRAQLAREAVERDTPLPAVAEYCAEHVKARRFKESAKEWRERLVGKRVAMGAQKETVKVWEERAKEAEGEAMGIGEFTDYTMEIYAAIVHGRRYKKGLCSTATCSEANKKCLLKCNAPMSQSHLHMPEHVKKLLRLVEQGKIPLPLGLEVPECDARVYGDLSLGGRTSDYDALTERRRAIHRKFMEAALTSPEEYSPVVRIPNPLTEEALTGRKIEVRLKMEDKNNTENTKGYFIHCFEGTIRGVKVATARRERKYSISSKHAVAHISWDSDFNDDKGNATTFDAALDPFKYAKDTEYLSSHNGWNLLSEEFVQWEEQEPEVELLPSEQAIGAHVF